MIALINQVVGLWAGSDGNQAEVIYDGVNSDRASTWDAVNSLAKPKEKIGVSLYLDDGEKISLSTLEIPSILPDRSGIMVIFDPDKPPIIEGLPDFHAPHNAAIFNANGSFRLRLTVKEGSYIHSQFSRTVTHRNGLYGQAGEKLELPIKQFGALVGDIGYSPEWFYVLDEVKSELQPTGQWVRY